MWMTQPEYPATRGLCLDELHRQPLTLAAGAITRCLPHPHFPIVPEPHTSEQDHRCNIHVASNPTRLEIDEKREFKCPSGAARAPACPRVLDDVKQPQTRSKWRLLRDTSHTESLLLAFDRPLRTRLEFGRHRGSFSRICVHSQVAFGEKSKAPCPRFHCRQRVCRVRTTS